jgi:hypothetical protein
VKFGCGAIKLWFSNAMTYPYSTKAFVLVSGNKVYKSFQEGYVGNFSFGGGTAAFHGDYNELDAIWNGANHIVQVAWADNRDVHPVILIPHADWLGTTLITQPEGLWRQLDRCPYCL